MSDYYPKAFELARTGKWEEAMKRYWEVQPARAANIAVSSTSTPGTSVHQPHPVEVPGVALRLQRRRPAPACSRLPDRFMKQLRASLEASGLPVTDSPDSEFCADASAPKPCAAACPGIESPSDT